MDCGGYVWEVGQLFRTRFICRPVVFNEEMGRILLSILQTIPRLEYTSWLCIERDEPGDSNRFE